MNDEVQYPDRLYTFEYKHLLLTLYNENSNYHFNITPYPLERIMNDSIRRVLRILDESEKTFFNEIKSLIEAKVNSDELYLLYRGTDKKMYPDIERGSDIESVSDFFYNYLHGSEKGRYSFNPEKLGTMSDISKELFIELFNKLNISLDRYSHNDSFKEYFQKIENVDNFISHIEKLSDYKKIRLKDYYFAYLHTVGTEESGRKVSYFVSTTKSISKGIEFASYAGDNEYQVLTYYLLSRPYLGSAIDSHENISLEELCISTSFPRYEALTPHENEVSIKGGLLPNHVLGIRCYIEDNEVFLVNPYLFMGGKTMEDMLIKGMPVNQREVRNQIERNKLHIVFTDMSTKEVYEE